MVLKGRRRAERDRAVTAAAVAVRRRRGCGARRTARVTDMVMIAVVEEELTTGEGRDRNPKVNDARQRNDVPLPRVGSVEKPKSQLSSKLRSGSSDVIPQAQGRSSRCERWHVCGCANGGACHSYRGDSLPSTTHRLPRVPMSWTESS